VHEPEAADVGRLFPGGEDAPHADQVIEEGPMLVPDLAGTAPREDVEAGAEFGIDRGMVVAYEGEDVRR
jgi:hypothetical protein